MNKKWLFIINGLLLAGIIYVYFVNPDTSEIISEHHQIRAVLSFAIFFITVNIISNTAKYIYSRKNKIPAKKKNNVHFGIENIANFIISVGLLITILSMFGINPRELLATLTIVAAAFAILTKEYFIDFFSGIYLSFSRTFEINDYVKIENQKGKILEISMMKIKMLNDDDDVVIIPNSRVYNNEIINYTKRDDRLMSVEFQIALRYISSIEQLEQELTGALQSFSEYIEPKSYNLKVVEMRTDHLFVKFQYTLKQVDMELQKKIRKRTMRQVFNFISSKKNPTPA